MSIWSDLIKKINLVGNLDFLSESYGIRVSSEGGLHCLKYGIQAPKTHWVTRACRGTVVSRNPLTGIYDLEAVGFERFYNLGEAEELQSRFDWSNFRAEEKWDGSLIKLFFYEREGKWVVSTSGSPRGSGTPHPNYGGDFSDLFWEAWDRTEGKPALNQDCVYVMELITPYNQIVVDYNGEWSVKLLTIRNKLDGFSELPKNYGNQVYSEGDLEYLKSFVNKRQGRDNEGLILVDSLGNRIKLKSSNYVSLHRLENNGSPEWFELWKQGEMEEVVSYFPKYRGLVDYVKAKIKEDKEETLRLIENFDGNHKEFALAHKNKRQFPFAMSLLRGKKDSFREVLEAMTPSKWKNYYLPDLT